MDLTPVKKYLEARAAVATDPAQALADIREALGVQRPTPVLAQSLAKALQPGTVLGDGLLELILRQANR
jgi:hypothetical protein